MTPPPQYRSDRWITPGVIMAALIAAGLVTSVVAAGVAYLAARGIDPDPMLKLVAQITTAIGSLGTLVLQLVSRSTVTKVERNTGVLATAVASTPAAAPAPVLEHEDLADEGTGSYPAHVPVPPLPDFARHRRTTT